MLSVVAKGLGNLKDEVVFVGGATIGLYLTEEDARDVRLTDDVDCVVELASRAKYYELEEKLRKLGFKQPMGEGHPICRWVYSGIYVDVMPTLEPILGFTNMWYKEGIAHAKSILLPNKQEISIFSAPYLFASKIEAFRGRGKDDFLASPDLEDIVILTDGCSELEEKISTSPASVKTYIQKQIQKLLNDEKFIEGMRLHLESTNPNQGAERSERALHILKNIAQSQP